MKLIRDLAESQEFQETEASRVILDDKALEARINTRLGERFTAGTGVTDIGVTAKGGEVVLKGVAIHSALAAEALKMVGAISGVKDVRNRIEIVHGPRGL